MSDYSTPEIIKSFEELYLAKKWGEAQELLNKHGEQVGQGWKFYNLGVLALKQNQLPWARFYFEKAQQLHFPYGGNQKNLATVKQQLGVSSIEDGVSFSYYWHQLKTPVILDALILSLLAVLGIFIGIKKYTKSFSKKNILVILLSIVCITGIYISSLWKPMSETEYIIIQETKLYEGPSSVFDITGQLPAGLKVSIDTIRDGYGRVDYPTDFSGWIKLNKQNAVNILKGE